MKGFMGDWGPGIFDNDSALDWIGDLLESEDASPVYDALKCALKHDGVKRKWFLGICVQRRKEKLPAEQATKALAAAEIVAARFGQPLSKLPNGVAEWLEQHSSLFEPELVVMAQQAMNKIKTDSELKQLWEEGDGAAKWLSSVADLERRLSCAA